MDEAMYTSMRCAVENPHASPSAEQHGAKRQPVRPHHDGAPLAQAASTATGTPRWRLIVVGSLQPVNHAIRISYHVAARHPHPFETIYSSGYMRRHIGDAGELTRADGES